MQHCLWKRRPRRDHWRQSKPLSFQDYHLLEDYTIPSNEHDDDDPALEQFLTDCRRFMADFPTLWGEVGEAPAIDLIELTTDQLVAEAHANREGDEYPTPEQLIENLPVVLRALCDHVLSDQPTALDVARRLASIGDAIEHVQGGPAGSEGTRH